jgi:hypothetical protein
MRILELFSGTGSVAKVAREMGHQVVSLDINNKYKPDICADIMHIDYKQWPKKSFDMVWASPPCDKFSVAPSHLFDAEQRRARALEGSLIARRTREILDWLEPEHWVVENPLASGLWKTDIFQDYPKKTVSYCMYSDWGYRKNTTLCMKNLDNFQPKRCTGSCGYVRQIKDSQGKIRFLHENVAKQGVSQHTKNLGVQQTTHRRWMLWRVPESLIKDILQAIP